MQLSVDSLNVGHNKQTVCADITLSLGAGATLLLGANGAGKTTLLSALTGALKPQTGSVRLLLDGQELDPYRARSRREYFKHTAWLPQDFRPLKQLTVREHIAYAGWLKGQPRKRALSLAAAAAEQVGLADRLRDPVGKLSGGAQRRVGIAGALVHDAKLVVLDEPMANLDIAQKAKLRHTLKAISGDRIVIVSSHDIELGEQVFDEVVVLDAGSIRYAGATAQLLAAHTSGTTSLQEAFLRLVADTES